MSNTSFCDGFYLNGPIGSDNWLVYLCCGKQVGEEDQTTTVCSCKNSITMKTSLREEFIEQYALAVNVRITNQPDIKFFIPERLGAKLRRRFEEDVIKDRKCYTILVNSLFKCKRHIEDDFETIAMVQGFIIYISWCVLALSGQNIGQSYFSTYLSQLGLELPITIKTSNGGKKYIRCEESLIKSLLSYKLMLSLDTVQQCLLSCNLPNDSWIKICLSWNRCIRPFFYQNEDADSDLATSSLYGIIMCFTNCLALSCEKNKSYELRLLKLEKLLSNCEDNSESKTPIKLYKKPFPLSKIDETSTTENSSTEEISSPKTRQSSLRKKYIKSRSFSTRRKSSSPIAKSPSLSQNNTSFEEESSSEIPIKRKCFSKNPPKRSTSLNRKKVPVIDNRKRSLSLDKYTRPNKKDISDSLARQILQAESGWKIYVAKKEYENSEEPKCRGPAHRYEFSY